MLTTNPLLIPRVRCRDFTFDRRCFSTVKHRFQVAPRFIFGQAWREAPSRDFSPACARVMGSETELWIWADLTDVKPHNAATAPNQNTWKLGDCFEIFLANSTDKPYYEMHITPENQTLQLRAESRDSARKIEKGPLRSATWLTPKGWQILASLPLDLLQDSARGWISFARYDYQSGRAEPVLSSTSPHLELDFHRRFEWTTFELQHDP